MKDPNQVIDAIPGQAREFIKIVNERCNTQLDFRDSSIAKLDEVAARWQCLSREEMLTVFDGMCFYLGEVIRRNLGGCWVDPRWKNPDITDNCCYLNRVGGILTVFPQKWVARRFLEGRSETFLSYYKHSKQKAKTIKKDLKKKQLSSSVSSGTLGVDKTISIITLLQLVSVLAGWVLCRMCARAFGGQSFGLAGFLFKYGYTLALIPMIWAPLMVYRNATDRFPTFIEKSLGVFGFLAIFVILGLFGWLVTGMILSLGSSI